jgi:hypothetical protein
VLDKILSIVKTICYAALAAAAIAIAVFVYQAQPILTGLRNDEDEAHRVLLEAALTAKEARLASSEERTFLNKTLPVLSQQVGQVLNNTSVALAGVNQTTRTLNRVVVSIGDNATMLSADGHQTLGDLQTTLLDLEPVEEKLNNTVRDTDLLITDPSIKDSLVHIDQSTQSLANAADHTDKATADIQQEIHAITHPPILSRIINYAIDVSHFIKF